MHTEIVYHRLACLVQTNKLYLSAFTAKFDNDFTIAAIAVTSQKCARDTSITTLETDSLISKDSVIRSADEKNRRGFNFLAIPITELK